MDVHVDRELLKCYKGVLEVLWKGDQMSSIVFDKEGPKEDEAYPGFLIKYLRKKDIFVPGSALEQFVVLRGGDPSAKIPKHQRARRFALAIRDFKPDPNPVDGKTIWDSKLRPPGTTGGNICLEVAEQERHFVVERALLQET